MVVERTSYPLVISVYEREKERESSGILSNSDEVVREKRERKREREREREL